MIFGCDAVSRSHASISALKLLSLHMCGAAALWRCKTVGWCLTGCGRACCDTGSAAHSHPVTVDKPMHKSVLVHPPIILRTMSVDSFDASAKGRSGEILRVSRPQALALEVTVGHQDAGDHCSSIGPDTNSSRVPE